MSQINPFTGAVAVTPQQQRLQSIDKALQLRKSQALAKNSAATTGDADHQVENPDAIVSIHEDDQHPQRQKQQPRHPGDPAPADQANDEPPRLDLTA